MRVVAATGLSRPVAISWSAIPIASIWLDDFGVSLNFAMVEVVVAFFVLGLVGSSALVELMGGSVPGPVDFGPEELQAAAATNSAAVASVLFIRRTLEGPGVARVAVRPA